MFNGYDPKINGETLFYCLIKENIKIIFDVGSRDDSEYLNFNGEVHYFDPINNFIETLKLKPNNNTKSYFNNFALGNETTVIYYYPSYESFFNRIISCNRDDSPNKLLLDVKKGEDYINEHNIKNIDFLKIDTEGFEFNVIKGFGNYLKNIKIIQFEYGGTFLDNNVKLIEVIDYLREFGFDKFSYLTNNGPIPIIDFHDHYNYCNIVCINNNSDFIPY